MKKIIKYLFFIFVFLNFNTSKAESVKWGNEDSIAVFGQQYLEKMKNESNEKFITCSSALRVLRVETLWTSRSYFEDILMHFLVITKEELDRRNISEESITQEFNKVHAEVKAIHADNTDLIVRGLSNFLAYECGTVMEIVF